MRFLRAPQQLQRPLIDRTFAHLAVEPRYGLGVVVEHIWSRYKNYIESVPVATEIRDQDFHLAARHSIANLLDGACENVGAAVGLVVAIHAGDHGMAQAHLCHRIGHAIGLIFIRRTNRLARGNRTKSARPRANVPENHERSRAMLPAFAHIRAAGAFADGMQVQGTHQALQVLEPRYATEFHTQPSGSRVHVWRRHRWCRRVGEDVKWPGHGVRAKLLFYAHRGPATNRGVAGAMVLSSSQENRRSCFLI